MWSKTILKLSRTHLENNIKSASDSAASLLSGAGGEFFAVFIPGVNPGSPAAREGVAGGGKHLAHVACREGVELFPLGGASVIPTAFLQDVKRVAIGHHLALAGADGVHFLAILVIDMVP